MGPRVEAVGAHVEEAEDRKKGIIRAVGMKSEIGN